MARTILYYDCGMKGRPANMPCKVYKERDSLDLALGGLVDAITSGSSSLESVVISTTCEAYTLLFCELSEHS
jgi:hypothetical protein